MTARQAIEKMNQTAWEDLHYETSHQNRPLEKSYWRIRIATLEEVLREIPTDDATKTQEELPKPY